jgi:glycosyltransferase involved in cell wall biosynthesis
MRLLMVSPALPTASGKGYQVRLYHQILGLAAKQHEVTLVAFGDPELLAPELKSACNRVIAVPWSLPVASARAMLALPQLPLSVGLYHDPRMARAVREAAVDCDLVHVAMVRMAPYLRQGGLPPVVLDLLDASELNMRERARAARTGSRQALLIEARRLGAYEKKAIAASSEALLISPRDLDYLGKPPNARVLANGVDVPRAPRPQRGPATIVFSGTMSYFPNVDAAVWFAREVLPSIQNSVPDASFRIVGREPSARVWELASLRGVTVTGSVTDIAQEIASATVAVCPMRYGSGMQTKILEAMAVGTPVVATGKALEGIPEDLHGYLHRADSPGEFATRVAGILGDSGPALRTAEDGLAVLARDHSWQRHVEQLEQIYQETLAAVRG